jgi:hypothetical protein
MSGPITAGYVLAHGTLLLAQAAIKEAHAIQQEYGEVLRQMRDREEEFARNRRAAQAARVERIAAIRRDAGRLTAHLERLRALAQTLAAHAPDPERALGAPIPPAPEDDDDAHWSAHLRALDAAVRELQGLLEQAGAASAEHLRAIRAANTAAPTLDDVLSAYALQRALQPGLSLEQSEQFRQTAARILSRLELAQSATLPPGLEALARSIVLAPSIERAEALASELRLAVQRQRAAQTAQRRESENARRLLEALPDDAPAPLARALERVAAGVERMDATLERSAQQVLDAAAADRAAREEQAAAYVLEQSLRDLGYEVEDIEATLFTDGGTAHFRRAGWDNYFVRLRVNAHEHTVNFNVVRASGAEQTAERSRLDVLAEDRWCAEFPRLLQTLAARGLALNVTRRLEAGAVPVQVVDPDQLPAVRREEDDGRPRSTPRAREIP